MPYMDHLDPNSPRNLSIEDAAEKLKDELGREPTDSEIQRELEREYWEAGDDEYHSQW